MNLPSLLNAISRLFRRPTAGGSSARRYTLVELAELAEGDNDEFDRVLAAAGVPPVPADWDAPVVRRKWSEHENFDRATFDYDAYIRSLKD